MVLEDALVIAEMLYTSAVWPLPTTEHWPESDQRRHVVSCEELNTAFPQTHSPRTVSLCPVMVIAHAPSRQTLMDLSPEPLRMAGEPPPSKDAGTNATHSTGPSCAPTSTLSAR